jgi:small subunit ribosomal protein S9
VAEENKFYWGTGRRKSAIARVRLRQGTGQILINKDRGLEAYFSEDKDREAVVNPLNLVDMRNRLDVFVNVNGGGFTGQAGAICQGIARALKDMFSEMPEPEAAPSLDGEEEADKDKVEPATPGGMVKKIRDSGYLTRDGRMKERKKYGRKGARKSFQFSKR